jgi:uncharacterized protein YceH (UPF0502 family)
MEREDGPFVTRLSRAPGAREARYSHLFSGQPADAVEGEDIEAEPARDIAAQHPGSRLQERVSALEELVTQLRTELDELKRAASGTSA